MNKIKGIIFSYVNLVSSLQSLITLLSRIIIGVVFLESGWGKLTHLDKVIAFFTTLGIPAPQLQAPFVASVELLGGFFILIGLATRFVSIPLMATMVVALVTAKKDDITDLNSLFGMAEFLYIAIFVWLLTFGAGRYSFDHLAWKNNQNPGG